MIDITQYHWWQHDFDDPARHEIDVWEDQDERVSEVLGSDGNPIRITRRRHRIGFDLRPASERGL